MVVELQFPLHVALSARKDDKSSNAMIIAGFCGNRRALQLGIQVQVTLRPTLLLELPIFVLLDRCHGAQDAVSNTAEGKDGGTRHVQVFWKFIHKVFGRELRQNVAFAIAT